MIIESLYYDTKWNFKDETIEHKEEVNLVVAYGNTDIFASSEHYEYLKSLYPKAQIVGASTAGNILDAELNNNSMVASAISFSSSFVETNIVDFDDTDDLEEVSKNLVSSFDTKDLKSIFIISDGLNVNGSILAKSVNQQQPGVLITGCLAGDGGRWEKTLVMANDKPKQRRIVAIAFYGEKLHVSSGCEGGWDEFGAERIITKSVGNIVYEIDDKPALELYKRYLGDAQEGLPGSGLRFPLSVKMKNDNNKEIMRTLLAVDEKDQSMCFAGDVPQGSSAKLMKTNIDGLINGSELSAKSILKVNNKDALGLVVSCVGRKIVMDQLVEEELDVIEDSLGSNVKLVGLYSYGELAPLTSGSFECRLHNQTMTLTVIYED